MQTYSSGKQGCMTTKLNDKGKSGNQARNCITDTRSLAQLMVGSAHKRDQHPLATTLSLSQRLRVCDSALSASHNCRCFPPCFQLAKMIQNIHPSVRLFYSLTSFKALLKRNNALKFSGIPPFLASDPVPSSASRDWLLVSPFLFLHL